jgi:hypothetical protein
MTSDWDHHLDGGDEASDAEPQAINSSLEK